MCGVMCEGMCVGICVDVCVDTRVDTCVGMCVDMCMDMCVHKVSLRSPAELGWQPNTAGSFRQQVCICRHDVHWP